MSKDTKTETIRVTVGSGRTVDSTIASRVATNVLDRIRAIQEAAAQQARRDVAQNPP